MSPSLDLGRRDMLQTSLAGALGASFTGWFARLAEAADQDGGVRKSKRRCILLWMDGGPSHLDTFDPKPDAPADVRGRFDAIATSVPGIQFSERFPRLAGQMKQLAVIRGMSTAEADHGRARIYMHTGFRPGQGGLTYPVLGSLVSAELGDRDFSLPSFVATGTPLGKYDFLTDPGYRGPRHGALVHYDPTRSLDNLEPLTSPEAFTRRERALAEMEQEFAARSGARAAEEHRALFERSVRLMRTDAARAFDISLEPEKSRQEYGEHSFGRGCLLARRLVEVGVPFVEVYLANWDTHEQKSADAAAELMPAVDQGMSALLNDLDRSGLLENTLVIWMGEFGRTPRVNRNGGRDHYAKAWTSLLAGCKIRGGQTIGRTDAIGSSVEDRPVSAPEFMASVCQALGIDHQREINTPVGRPVTIVDKGVLPVAELFS